MKRAIAPALFAGALIGLVELLLWAQIPPHIGADQPKAVPSIAVFFSPGNACQDAVVAECGKAKKEIRVACYSFTSEPIAEALAAAAKRGVDVRMIVDHKSSTENGCKIPEVLKAGALVWTDDRHPIFHDKYIVYDGSTLSTGSFNFSHGGTVNAEQMLVIKGDNDLCKKYLENFALHLSHSVKAK
jgi:phosphatidylserine/phosphatidylglycerophosphate/cardiolipin synthase-like enzyme